MQGWHKLLRMYPYRYTITLSSVIVRLSGKSCCKIDLICRGISVSRRVKIVTFDPADLMVSREIRKLSTSSWQFLCLLVTITESTIVWRIADLNSEVWRAWVESVTTFLSADRVVVLQTVLIQPTGVQKLEFMKVTHSPVKAYIESFYPLKHGSFLDLFQCKTLSSHIRNVMWEDVLEIAWSISDEPWGFLLLKQLNKTLNLFKKFAVCVTSSGKHPYLERVSIPAATLWLKTWVARLTFRWIKGGTVISILVILGARRIGRRWILFKELHNMNPRYISSINMKAI